MKINLEYRCSLFQSSESEENHSRSVHEKFYIILRLFFIQLTMMKRDGMKYVNQIF